MAEKYDIVIIGAGPGGYHTAIDAAKKGQKVAIIERHKTGGTCLNYGCMPTKIMLDAAVRIMDKTSYAKTEIDQAKLFAHRDMAVKQLSGGVAALLKMNGVKLYAGEGRFTGESIIEVTGNTGDKTSIQFENAVIATGSTVINLPFLNDFKKYTLNSDIATNMAEVPKSVCIIGGGVIGIEFAYIFRALGSEVTVVEILDRILINEEPVVSEFIKDELQKSGIDIIVKANISKLEESGESINLYVDDKVVSVEKILCAVGRRPNTGNLNLEAIGENMVTERGAVIVDESFRTACPNVYAIGDANGLMMLAHAASAQGSIVVDKIVFGKNEEWDASLVPKCVYIEPEIASVGLTEEQAKVLGGCKTALYPMAANGKAIALGKTEGFIKVIADGDDRILGISIVGEKATELITIATEVIRNKLTVEQAAATIYPHPTFAEALKDAILKINGMAVHA